VGSFIKTRKTAGTSLEMFLSGHCGPDDIVTPITLEDERLRIVEGRVAAKNFSSDPVVEAAYRDAVLRNDKIAVGHWRGEAKKNGGYYNHMPATQVREMVSRPFWDTAFKFTIERHPYEKVISLAYWRMANQRSPEQFEAMVEAIVQAGDHNDFGLYAENSDLLVDKIYRQEFLNEAIAEICSAIGVSDHTVPVHAKSGHRKDRRPARNILTEDQKREIRKRSAFSFDVLGFEP
jgi:hypothetical protein